MTRSHLPKNEKLHTAATEVEDMVNASEARVWDHVRVHGPTYWDRGFALVLGRDVKFGRTTLSLQWPDRAGSTAQVEFYQGETDHGDTVVLRARAVTIGGYLQAFFADYSIVKFEGGDQTRNRVIESVMLDTVIIDGIVRILRFENGGGWSRAYFLVYDDSKSEYRVVQGRQQA